MTSSVSLLPGWIDTSIKLLRGILRSSQFKDNMSAVLKKLESQSAPHTIKDFLWTDPLVSLSLLKMVPYAANLGQEAVRECVLHLEHFSHSTLASLWEEGKSKIRTRTFGELAGRITALVLFFVSNEKHVSSNQESSLVLEREFVEGFSFGYKKACPHGETGLFKKTGNPTELPWSVIVYVLEMSASWLEKMAKQYPSAIPSLLNGMRQILVDHPDLDKLVISPLRKAAKEIWSNP